MKKNTPSFADLFPQNIFVTKGQDGDLFAFVTPKDVIEHYGPREPIRVIVYRQNQVADINPEYSISYVETKRGAL